MPWHVSQKKYKMKIFIIGKSSNLAKHLLKKLENRPDIKVCSISTKKILIMLIDLKN